jgi:hypothetical protein
MCLRILRDLLYSALWGVLWKGVVAFDVCNHSIKSVDFISLLGKVMKKVISENEGNSKKIVFYFDNAS